MTYLILQNPGHNRVYYNLADKLALAELKIALVRLSTSKAEAKILLIAGIRYLGIETNEILSGEDIKVLSRLSFVFALFKLENKAGQQCLIPIERKSHEYLDNKISTLLKYHGKTNELFTRMMINVALLSSDFNYDDNINLLDPVAGKGTTLFEGAVYGFDVFGIEIEPKSVHETSVFIKKYLQTERFKHTVAQRQIAGAKKTDAIYINEFVYARSKEEFKNPDSIRCIGIVGGNAKEAHQYFKQEKFNLIVGDLPYGIVHGNTGDNKTSSVTRNPSELLNECVADWYKTLKKGGVVVMAWNSFLASRQKLSNIFSIKGFEVLSEAPYNEFEHMVDKSIKRDIVVAKRL